MRRLSVALFATVLLFSFVACSGDAGGNALSGNPEGMSAAEIAIMNTYGEATFKFAQLADMVGSYADLIEDVCGSANPVEAAAAILYPGLSLSGASSSGLTIVLNDGGATVTVVISNVVFSIPRGPGDDMLSFDSAVTVSGGGHDESAEISMEIDLEVGTTTITSGRYKTVVFGMGSEAVEQANLCLSEIMDLDGDEGLTPNPNPIVVDAWVDGTASLPYSTIYAAYDLIGFLEGTYFEVTIIEPQGGFEYHYNFGRIDSNRVWAVRYDYCPPEVDPDFEAQYDMIALDRTPGNQVGGLGEHHDQTSDYLVYEGDGYGPAWLPADPTFYNEQDWHDAMVFWLYDDEDIFTEEYAEGPNATYAGGIYFHYSDLLKPYTPLYIENYNGKYQKLAGTRTVAGITCEVYRYRNELFYIADAGHRYICMKHSRLVDEVEQTVFVVDYYSDDPIWPIA